ncbi:MAG TPA: methionyl-tRNA formyltransferase [Exilispira sp.]|nr:methionyl-tRNA formyltransferase [Exilispira sp.]
MDRYALFVTSDFGIEVAKYLFDTAEVVFVLTSQPKPKGRHFIIEDIETVKLAKKKEIQVIYVEKSFEIFKSIETYQFDYGVVIDFAFILKKEVLSLAKKMFINLHPSLLPKYRGPSPLHFQIIDNVLKTGVTIIKMDCSIDAGDILFQVKTELEYLLNFTEFYDYMRWLSQIAFELYIKNKEVIIPIPQKHEEATYTRKISKEDAYINPEEQKSDLIIGKIKAFEKWPKVKIKAGEDIFILLDARKYYKDVEKYKPGCISIEDRHIIIGTADLPVEITEIQKLGKKPQSTVQFLFGFRKRYTNLPLEREFSL